MPTVNLFILLPESNPSNQWMYNNQAFQAEDRINGFIYELTEKLKEIEIENYIGYYDLENILNFLDDFNVLEEFYPFPVKRLLASSISSFYDWRLSIIQSDQTQYTIFTQDISNHTFCEIAERKNRDVDSCFMLLNHYGHALPNTFMVSFNEANISIDSISDKGDVVNWFVRNRQPPRNFQVTDKHGENRQEVRIIDNKEISPLRCFQPEAETLLQSSIGFNNSELFNLDEALGYYIVFRHEGNNPQNMYHGYHVDLDSTEVPADIKDRLRNRNN